MRIKLISGEFPFLVMDNDFFFIENANPEHIAQTIPELVKVRIPSFLKCDPIEDIQVLPRCDVRLPVLKI